jgi:carbamate kinase
MKNVDVIALGGNAILPAGKAGTITEQFEVTRVTMDQIVRLIEHGRTVVLTHGNGPIVGNIVLRNEAASDIIPPMPLDICGADSQGGIGYMIQQTLGNILRENGIGKNVVSLVTQVLVDKDDPAFKNPVKPIGPFYSREEAGRLTEQKGWSMIEDSNRGYRRAVPSPKPVEIIEKPIIEQLVEKGEIVVTVGGGGVPVVREGDNIRGVEAVIDKDLASAVLARDLDADRLIILTSVDAVYKGFGTPHAEALHELSDEEARKLLAQGEFPPGSMGRKIEAALSFLSSEEKLAVIAQPENLADALEGKAGTRIFKASK